MKIGHNPTSSGAFFTPLSGRRNCALPPHVPRIHLRAPIPDRLGEEGDRVVAQRSAVALAGREFVRGYGVHAQRGPRPALELRGALQALR
jgi:hypothetical protein